MKRVPQRRTHGGLTAQYPRAAMGTRRRRFGGAVLRMACLVGIFSLLVANGRAVESGIIPRFSQRTWDRSKGLPGNEVAALCLDRVGYLWIATPTGLVRFDGSRFLNYDLGTGIKGGRGGLVAIAGDPASDGVWAAPSTGGLFRFHDGHFEEFALPEGRGHQRVARLFVARDAALWIAFEGGEVMRLKDGHAETFGEAFGLGPRRSSQIAADGTGRVWVANGRRLFCYEAGALRVLADDTLVDNLRIATARSDGPWVLAQGVLAKVVGDRLVTTALLDPGYNARSVQALTEDSSGRLWVGTRSRGIRTLWTPGPAEEFSIETPEDVGALVEDRSGNLWIGSNGGGLMRLREGVLRFFDKSQGLRESHALGVCEDATGTVWIANRDGGLAFVNESGRVQSLAPPRSRESFSVRSVAPSGPAGVIATTSLGLLRADRGGIELADAPDAFAQPPEHGEMRLTLRAMNGDLWVDLDPGRLGRLRAGQWEVFTSVQGLASGALQAIAEDSQGRIWIGTENSRVAYFDGAKFFTPPGLIPDGVGSIQALHFESDGTGWAGTSQGGLLRIGPVAARRLGALQGLSTNNVTQIISDDFGSLWLGSPDGIFHVRREDLEQFFAGKISRVDAVALSADEGLGEVNCVSDHHPSVWKSHDGLLWFATRQGVVAIDPRRDKIADLPLATRIDAVRVGEQDIPVTGTEVRLPPLNRTLELDYSVLCLSNPERVRARYRLHGYDDDWIEADRRGLARYARLPPGSYVFEVSARVAGAPATATKVSLAIEVEAAWWQTVWFRLAVAGLVLVTGSVVARVWFHRRLRARLAQLEQASAVERERARIAQNIHDELGSGLTRISLLTQAEQVGDGRVQLDRIYGTVSDLTQSMDEIVWAVNPKHDNLEGLANYVVEFAQGFLTDAGIRCRVRLPDFFPLDPLTTQARHHLFMACKEALHNVVKHAHATEVILEIAVADGRIRIDITDNGRGLPAEPAAGPGTPRNGVANMRARLAALAGTCEIAGTTCTTVTFSAPLAPPPNFS